MPQLIYRAHYYVDQLKNMGLNRLVHAKPMRGALTLASSISTKQQILFPFHKIAARRLKIQFKEFAFPITCFWFTGRIALLSIRQEVIVYKRSVTWY